MQPSDFNILIVDDVQAMRTQFRELLRAYGFNNVHLASSGLDATQILRDVPVSFDLILCDWHMSPVNGLELLEAVRQMPKTKNAAFVMVTAETTKDCVLQAIQAGVDDYILKPLVLAHINKIYKVLLKKQAYLTGDTSGAIR